MNSSFSILSPGNSFLGRGLNLFFKSLSFNGEILCLGVILGLSFNNGGHSVRQILQLALDCINLRVLSGSGGTRLGSGLLSGIVDLLFCLLMLLLDLLIGFLLGILDGLGCLGIYRLKFLVLIIHFFSDFLGNFLCLLALGLDLLGLDLGLSNLRFLMFNRLFLFFCFGLFSLHLLIAFTLGFRGCCLICS